MWFIILAGDEWLAGVSQGGKKPKLKSWKVSKLTGIALTASPFTPDAGFDPSNAEYGNQIKCSLGI